MRPITALLLGPFLLLSLGGCESLRTTDSLFGVITPYRIDIVQGNVVTKEQLAALKVGMPKVQVRDVLGTPLLTDPFHGDRWDYIFTIRRPGAELQRRSVILRFDGETLKSIDAPELPSEKEFVAAISSHKETPQPKLELSEEERKALPKPAKEAAPPASAEPVGPTRDYPPLETSS